MGQAILLILIVLVAANWPRPMMWTALILGCLFVGSRFIVVAFPYLLAGFFLYLIWYGLTGKHKQKEKDGKDSEGNKDS